MSGKQWKLTKREEELEPKKGKNLRKEVIKEYQKAVRRDKKRYYTSVDTEDGEKTWKNKKNL